MFLLKLMNPTFAAAAPDCQGTSTSNRKISSNIINSTATIIDVETVARQNVENSLKRKTITDNCQRRRQMSRTGKRADERAKE